MSKIKRLITRRFVNHLHDVTAYGNPLSNWLPLTKDKIILDIESGRYQYVIEIGYTEIKICVIHDSDCGDYLRSDPSFSESNVLETLPGIRY